MEYRIHEANVERLEKKLTTIRNKCEKYGCAYNFEKKEEIFVTDENDNVAKYIVYEVEGVAKQNGWTFVATVDFTENGNVVRKVGNMDVEVPDRYYTTTPICEHCSRQRRRKNAYIVTNEEGEFKQVGRSCLKDFTRGLDAELVTNYIQMFDSLIEGESVDSSYLRTYRYIDTKELLAYAVEVTNKFGYTNAYGKYPTKVRVANYYELDHGWIADLKNILRSEMEAVNFNACTKENQDVVTKMLEWLDTQQVENNYIHNLKTLCTLSYVTPKDIGIVSSLVVAYQKAMEKEAYHKAQKIQAVESKHIGNIGDRIVVQIASCTLATSWETQYGITRIWKITDSDNNIYTWKTGNWIDDEVTQLIGTVKAHTEFRGAKQTELTRCKTK